MASIGACWVYLAYARQKKTADISLVGRKHGSMLGQNGSL